MNISDLANKGKVTYSAKNPYFAKVREIRSLNLPGSTKENLHVVLDLEDSEISYTVGSSVGLYPENAPQYVEQLLNILGVDASDKFFHERSEKILSYGEFLIRMANLSKIQLSQLKFLYEHTQNETLSHLITDKEKRKAFIEENNLFSLLSTFYHSSISAEKFCNLISPMLPRFYSIASSMQCVGNEVHLMVASFSYLEAKTMKQSITTEHLIKHCKVGGTIAMFVQPNHTFAIPSNSSTPVVMIGPGTGLAAFRGFIQERFIASKASKNWLFTGDRNRKFDFHYEDELMQYAETDFLRLDVAFSRDGDAKIYVQDKMWQSRHDLWHWIKEEKAQIYISGDAKKMAKDVMATLEKIALECGEMEESEAKEFLKQLKKEKRLLLDVY